MTAHGAQRGQALPAVLALAGLVLAGAIALFALGRAQVAAVRAQTVADVAAISAARELRARLDEAAAAGPAGAGDLRARLAAVAAAAAAPARARVERLEFPDAAWPPTAVQLVVSVAAPRDLRARAVARAGLRAQAPVAVGATVMATGGGYAGPLVNRDGRPMCPAVAAAFDLMDAAAHGSGIDLVVTSGYRSDAEQAILFARHPDPRWVAPPGRSRHRDATELDLNMLGGGAAHAWLTRNAARFGFRQRYAWEPWHWGYLPGCGPDGGGVAAGGGSLAAEMPASTPRGLRSAIASAAAANGLPPALLAALLQAESGYDPRAVSDAGALGIAQLMPATARSLGVRDPFDATEAIPAAARLLGGHVRTFGSIPVALAAYNAGEGAVRRYGGIPPYPETQAYVARILALAGGGAAIGGGTGGDGVTLLHVPGRPV